MQNLHDDNFLDDMSRDAAERFETDPGLHSWQKLQLRLDEELPQKKKKRRFLIILFFFLLVGGGITFAVWNRDNGNGTGTKKQSAQVRESATATREPEHAQEKTPLRKQAAAASTPAAQQSNEVAADSRPQVNTSPLRQPVRKAQKTRQPTANKQKLTQETNHQSQNNYTQPVNTETPVEELKEEAKTDTAISVDQRPSTDTAAKDKTIAQQQEKQEQPEQKKKNKPGNTPFKRWEIGLTFAPDISTVRFTHTQKPGTNYGLIVGYNISRRWSVNAGVLYTSKNYKVGGPDYHPPKGYWTDYVKLETVEGNCDMWDIPINVRYNVLPRRSSNFFVSTGLSSYLMEKEDYEYYYYYTGNPNLASRQRSYEDGNKYWFSVLNFSLGYERQLSKHFSIQAEPFFKQPLKGLGFGSIRLNTTGVFFTGKYKF